MVSLQKFGSEKVAILKKNSWEKVIVLKKELLKSNHGESHMNNRVIQGCPKQPRKKSLGCVCVILSSLIFEVGFFTIKKTVSIPAFYC